MTSDEWRDIPGFDGAYQINTRGDVRSWRKPNGGRSEKPRLLSTHRENSKSRRNKGAVFVSLTNGEGKSRPYPILRLMVMAWIGQAPPGMIPYHKNGDKGDNEIYNIAFTTPCGLGKRTGKNAYRKPVAKIDSWGRVVEIYPSAAEAGRKNHMSAEAVRARCKGWVKHPFELNGYTYRFEK